MSKIKVYKFESDTEENCRIKCLEDLDVYQNDVVMLTTEIENGCEIKTVKKSDILEFINKYIENISKFTNLNIKTSITEEENIFNVKMYSNNNPLLIGKDGKNLKALQILLRQAIKTETGISIKINLDASNYKQKQDKYFERDIKKILNDIMINKDEVKLDPMNSYKRRIVHSIASDYYNIETESFGEEPERYVVIKYVEK